MHQHYSVSSFFIAALASALLSPAQAQQAPGPGSPVRIVEGSFSGIQRIVDECQIDSASTLCAQSIGTRKTRTVTLQIPGFRPGDQQRHVYVMSRIDGTGAGGGTAVADENGLLRNEEIDPDSEPGADPDAEEVQHYFTAYDIVTREPRVTLDLYQVRITPFIKSLEMSMQMADRVIERQQGLPSRPGTGIAPEAYNLSDRRLTIQGQNLGIDEVLDLVYRETGCIVDQDELKLVFTGCS